MDLSLYAAWPRVSDISQSIQKIFKNYPKIDYQAFASSRRHYAADNRTARDIQNLGPFWVVKIQGGAMPPWPTGTSEQIYLSLRDRRSRREDTFFGAKFSIRFF